MKVILQAAVLSALALTACDTASATPTALNIIPTAQVLADGQAHLGYYTATTLPRSGRIAQSLCETQYGWGGKFEFGLDPILSSRGGVLINGKLRIFDESRLTPAVAIGVQNAGPNLSNQPYLAALKTFPIVRLHFGVIGDSGSIRAMFGFEKPCGNQFTFQCDYISGSDNWFTIGFVAGGATGWQFNPSWLIGNSPYSGNGYSIDLEWIGKLPW